MDMENLIITCSVCQDSLADSSRMVIASPICGHVYHSECLANWFQSSARNLGQGSQANFDVDDLAGKCPACDSDFNLNFGIQLFLNAEEDLERTAQTEKLRQTAEELESAKEQNSILTAEITLLKSKCVSLTKELKKASGTPRKHLSQPQGCNTTIFRPEPKASANVSRISSSRGSVIVGMKRSVHISATPMKSTADRSLKKTREVEAASALSGLVQKARIKRVPTVLSNTESIAKPASSVVLLKGILKKPSSITPENIQGAGASASPGPMTRSKSRTEEPSKMPPRIAARLNTSHRRQ
ncbi:unnamed protein product [Orchesella dallaii]|uniref:RING-type domain-containing protein n=1 Tax=Orchesella dallaii TaxID=48710 RepID=A0ABP1RR93_9HEXA